MDLVEVTKGEDFMISMRERMLALLALLVIGGGGFSVETQAGESGSIRQEIRDKQSDKKDKNQQISANLKIIAQIDAGVSDGGEVDFGCSNSDCSRSCLPQKGYCTEQDLKVFDISADQREVCVQIFRKNPAFDRELTSESCVNAIKRCGTVARELKKKELQRANRELKLEIEVIDRDIADLKKEERDASGQCENCRQAAMGGMGGMGQGGQMGQMGQLSQAMNRSPSTGELIIQGISALTPAIGMGLNTYLGAKSLNSYYSGYNNYLEQCKTVGVPCQGPRYAGASLGGYGLGGYGMSGLGFGYGMGMPTGFGYGSGLGGSPFGMGATIGMPGGGMFPGSSMGYGMGMSPYAMNGSFGFPGNGMSYGYPGLGSGYGSGVGYGYGGSPFTSGYGSLAYPQGTGFNSGLFPYGSGSSYPYGSSSGYPYYQGTYQSSYQQALYGQRSAQQQQDSMIAQQQMMEAQQRYLQLQMSGYTAGGNYGSILNGYGSYGYSGYGYPSGTYGLGVSIGGGF